MNWQINLSPKNWNACKFYKPLMLPANSKVLSTRFVRIWRGKHNAKGETIWLRRSLPVSLESERHNFMKLTVSKNRTTELIRQNSEKKLEPQPQRERNPQLSLTTRRGLSQCLRLSCCTTDANESQKPQLTATPRTRSFLQLAYACCRKLKPTQVLEEPRAM